MKNNKLFNQNPIYIMATAALVCSMFFSARGQTTLHGFNLIEKRFVREVGADCYYYQHVQSGAQLLKIAAADNNKTFGIAFKTIPDSDDGVAHIMEHSVLNGSKKYPVKSPFDELSKGSLKTFLNAFTSKDYTMYPVASMNEKDYFNLMGVYLDAVFNPLIYDDPRIMDQEGWHYELTSHDAPLIYKGVVYNEMKGAYSSPQRELSYQLYKLLFPESPYGFESGGYPSAIPSLTYQKFLDFHKRFYSPQNSYIVLYGDADIDKELEFIDREYLSKYTKGSEKVNVREQPAFAVMKETKAYYPVMENAETKNQTYLTLAWVAGKNTDQFLVMALDVLCDLLVNEESAPLRLALEEKGIGKDVRASVSNYYQNVVNITVQNANPEDKDKFYETVITVLKDAVKKGLDKKDLHGLINRTMFYLREDNTAQKGLRYMTAIQPAWFFADDPFAGLEYEKPLAELKKTLESDDLEKIISQHLLNNNHRALLVLEPSPGMEKKKEEITASELSNIKKKMTKAAQDSLIAKTRELIEYQKRDDKAEDLAKIPMLQLEDIDKAAAWYGCDEKTMHGNKVLYFKENTNGIAYFNLYFDLHALSQDMIPYASLLSNILGSLNTGKYSYGELNRMINTHTGGFSTYTTSYQEELDDTRLKPFFAVTIKAMTSELAKSFEITQEMLNNTIFTDTDRLKSVIIRHHSQLDSRMKRDGYQVAIRRLNSYFDNKGVYNELTDGLDYYWFLTDLVNNFDARAGELSKTLKTLSNDLFRRQNLTITLTCGDKELDIFDKELEKLVTGLSDKKPAAHDWKFVITQKNEAIMTTSKVQYVIAGYNFSKLGYKWEGRMRVLNQIISRDWLKNQIRVIGGAYGGSSSISPAGVMIFSSYRDPNLGTTLENFNATVDYLKRFNASDAEMTRYIIGTISGMDVPLTAKQKGDQAVVNYYSKRSLADMQKDRDAILSARSADISGYSKFIKDILEKKAIVVYGSNEKIQAEKNLFKNLITLDKK